MRGSRWKVWMFVSIISAAAPALADQHIADPPAIATALSEKADRDTANRAALTQTLQKPEVQHVAGRLGLTVHDTDTAVRTLSGDELAWFADQARAIDDGLAGGAQTITISITTLLLLLILVVLIVAL